MRPLASRLRPRNLKSLLNAEEYLTEEGPTRLNASREMKHAEKVHESSE